MEANEGIESCAKDICANGQMLHHDQAPPLECGLSDELGAECAGDSDPGDKRAHPSTVECTLSEHHCHAAGQQTYRRPNRQLQNVLGIWTSATATDVEQVGND